MSILVTAGELGYERVASEGARFAEAHEAGLELAYGALIAAAENGGEPCEDRIRAALTRLVELMEAEPAIARALLIEAREAGPDVLEKHTEILERLSRAIESARRETRSRHSSSPLTGVFIVGAIESVVCTRLADPDSSPRSLWSDLPGLVHFAVLPYLGEAAAWAAHDAALSEYGDRAQ